MKGLCLKRQHLNLLMVAKLTHMIKPNISDCEHIFLGHVPDTPKLNIKCNDPNLAGCKTASRGGEIPFNF